MELSGTKTEQNLMEAFTRESEARNQYTFYAAQAKTEGYLQIANLFEKTANNEAAHAKIWYQYLNDGIQDTRCHLKNAAANENYEWTQMYKQMANEAREEGFEEIACVMEQVADIEKAHEARYVALLHHMEDETMFEKKNGVVWECLNCGHLHYGCAAPDMCPVCQHSISFFEVQCENY